MVEISLTLSLYQQRVKCIIRGSINLSVEKLIAFKDQDGLKEAVDDYAEYLSDRIVVKPKLEASIGRYFIELYDKACSEEATDKNKLKRRVLSQLIWGGITYDHSSIYNLLEDPIRKDSTLQKFTAYF